MNRPRVADKATADSPAGTSWINQVVFGGVGNMFTVQRLHSHCLQLVQVNGCFVNGDGVWRCVIAHADTHLQSPWRSDPTRIGGVDRSTAAQIGAQRIVFGDGGQGACEIGGIFGGKGQGSVLGHFLDPGARLHRTGVAHAIASSTGMPNPSNKLG